MADPEASPVPVDEPLIDITKTQVVYEHYTKKYRVYDTKEYKWIPYDPTSVPPPPPPPVDENPGRYFTILQQYQRVGESMSGLSPSSDWWIG